MKKALFSYECLAIAYVSILLLGCDVVGRVFG